MIYKYSLQRFGAFVAALAEEMSIYIEREK